MNKEGPPRRYLTREEQNRIDEERVERHREYQRQSEDAGHRGTEPTQKEREEGFFRSRREAEIAEDEEKGYLD